MRDAHQNCRRTNCSTACELRIRFSIISKRNFYKIVQNYRTIDRAQSIPEGVGLGNLEIVLATVIPLVVPAPSKRIYLQRLYSIGDSYVNTELFREKRSLW
jgi:hypothetical protein